MARKDGSGRSGPRERAAMHRALEAVRAALAEQPDTAPSLARMAEAADVSPRTLQRHFARTLKCPPRAVVQRLRLAAARQILMSGEAPSVLAAATRHGFDHPGRFAIAYARAFGESPSTSLRAARARCAPADAPGSATPIVLRPLALASAADAARARRLTDDLSIALGRRARDLMLVSPEPGAIPDHRHVLRLEGRVDGDCVVLSLVQPARGAVLRTMREPLRDRAGLGWADRAAGAVGEAIAAERLEQARRTPRHRADVETLVLRARPAILMQDPGLAGMALGLLDEALHRDPAHARAYALAAFGRSVAANHCFTRDPQGERARAIDHGQRALELACDDPEVLTLVGGVMSLNQRLDEAECLVTRALALDPNQPEAWRRLGFIQNFRGNGRVAAAAFRRALRGWPTGNDGNMATIGLGIAKFIIGDYARSARALSRAVEQQPSRGWPYRFLTAAAVHAGAHEEARRSLASLRRCFPDLTVDQCAQSDALHREARVRVLEGLARAGLPR
jgi:AraC-like DNA-binding protein